MAAVASKARERGRDEGKTGCFYCPREASKIQSAGCDLQSGSPEPIHSTSPPLQLSPFAFTDSLGSWGSSLHNEEKGTVHKHAESTMDAFLFDFCAV